MNLTVFGLLAAYGVDSGAVMATSDFYDYSDIMTKMVWSQGSYISLSGAYCIALSTLYSKSMPIAKSSCFVKMN